MAARSFNDLAVVGQRTKRHALNRAAQFGGVADGLAEALAQAAGGGFSPSGVLVLTLHVRLSVAISRLTTTSCAFTVSEKRFAINAIRPGRMNMPQTLTV